METILEIAIKHMKAMLEHDIEISDFSTFVDKIKQYERIDCLESKPHLVYVEGNMWEVYHDLNDDMMKHLGYECVGRMSNDMRDDDDKYIFECEDEIYDILYRLKNPRHADFTKTLRI